MSETRPCGSDIPVRVEHAYMSQTSLVWSQTRPCGSDTPVWVGHCCPTPLTFLISTNRETSRLCPTSVPHFPLPISQLCHSDRSRPPQKRWSAKWRNLGFNVCVEWGSRVEQATRKSKSAGRAPLKTGFGLSGDVYWLSKNRTRSPTGEITP